MLLLCIRCYIITCLLKLVCIIMLLSTLYIVYRLANNRFDGRCTNRQMPEWRSIILILVVLIVFLISEAPRIVMPWLVFSYLSAIGRMTNLIGKSLPFYSSAFMYLVMEAISDHFKLMTYFDFKIFSEILKYFTVIGCISNFVIYIGISRNLRKRFKRLLLFKFTCNSAYVVSHSNVIEITHF
jgi:hypothetical protein